MLAKAAKRRGKGKEMNADKKREATGAGREGGKGRMGRGEMGCIGGRREKFDNHMVIKNKKEKTRTAGKGCLVGTMQA